MKYKFLDKEIKYDGSQLHSLFGYECGISGNSIISFIGPAEVKEHLVDCEDRLNNDFIKSEKMLHFVITIFDASLRETVAFQRLFISMIVDRLHHYCSTDTSIERRGDDIFINEKKFSVSIATKSLLFGLIHIGLNIEVGKECPVDAIGFYDFFVSYPSFDFHLENALPNFAYTLQCCFVLEFENIQEACYKVKGVS